MLANLEKERSNLMTRATLAESQNKAMQDNMGQQAQKYNKQIAEMKKLLKEKGVDVSKY